MARKKSVEIELDLQDRDAKRALKDITRELGNTEDAFDDAESAGKQMAKAISRAADDMIEEIDATKRAVDEMERALDGTDMDPREVVADLKSIGLTAQDIEQDAEELAEALKKSGDVKTHATKQGFDDVGQAVGSVREETGRAKDTMHGFVGGAVGELPLIGEAMGPVAEGMGQLTEGVLAGEIAFKDLAKVVGPMAGITAGVMLLQKAMASVEETEAFNREQIDSMRDALLDINDAAEAYKSTLDETEEITARTGGAFGFFEDNENIMDDLVDAGVNVDLWTEAVTGNVAAQDEVRSRLEALVQTHKEHRDSLREGTTEWGEAHKQMQNAEDALEGLDETMANNATAAEEAADHQEFYGDALEDSTEAMEAAIEATDRSIEAQEKQAEALRDATDALEEQLDAQLAATDAGYALEKAQFDLIDTVTKANEVFAAAEQGSREYREAELDVIDAANGVAQAEIRKAEETAAASGKTLTATERIDAMNASLVTQASQLNGPARQALIDHIAQVNNIPASKMTEIEAAIAAGDLETAESLLNEASRARTSAVGVDLNREQEEDVERRLNNLARWRGTGIDINVPVRGRGATGGIVTRPTVSLIGEAGPEAVIPLNRMPGASPLPTNLGGGGGGGNTNVYVTQNFPAGVRSRDVLQAQRRYERTQGPV